MALASYMRAPPALVLAILVSGLSLSAVSSVSADRLGGGPCTSLTCPPPPDVVFSAPVVDDRTGTVVLDHAAHGAWPATYRGYPPARRSARVSCIACVWMRP